ncbi:hypothetical protein [Candidatus Symbiopectobacterium endolongispinus]|uniref:hypothetical protein n=1 Tax=Candidatus Symbiopectobacterium endolongispinus TaxID=2812664 RepID=UPI001A35469C|nr:hypothetical protein [Candidatus Symbiopectobacterium sp. PLON1]MBT9428196.1 hypothetical protein [Candidatus Symbiopectobacterium endolongispinus]
MRHTITRCALFLAVLPYQALEKDELTSFNDSTRKEMQYPFPDTLWEEMGLRWLVSPRNAALSGSGPPDATGSADTTSGLGTLKSLMSTLELSVKQIEVSPGSIR